MATTTTARGSNGQARTPDSPPARLRASRSIRRGEVLVGLLLAIAGGLIAKAFVDQADKREPVVVVRNDVAEGAVLNASDLGVARVAIDRACGGKDRGRGCINVIAGDRLDSFVGRVASVPLRRGTLLASSQIAEEGAARPDEVITAVPIPKDRLPMGIEVGDRVRIIDTGGGGRLADAAAEVLIESARVFALQEPERLNNTVVVSIVVPAGDAPAVTSAVASDRVGLVLLTSR